MRTRKLLFLGLALVLAVGSSIGLVPKQAQAAELPPQEELLLHYDMKNVEGTTVRDTTGRFNGTWVNPQNAALLQTEQAGAIQFAGGSTSSYIELPEGVLNGLSDITVSFLINWSGARTAEWAYALGQPAASTNYLYYTPKYNADSTARFGIATNGWRNEVSAKGSTLPSNEWKLVTTVLSEASGTLTYYVDGTAVQSASTNGFTLSQIKSTSGLSGYIGRSFYSADPYLGGMMADFKIYKTALTADQVSALKVEANQKIAGMDRLILNAAANPLSVSALLGTNPDKDHITTDLVLPTQGLYGTSISWLSSNPNVISNQGVVTRPEFEAGDQTVGLTATVSDGSESVQRTFMVTVLKKPSDGNAVRMDAAALQVYNIQDVRGNLTLPVRGPNGSTISWRSEQPDVITPTGEVTRPAHGSGDRNVQLTATLTLNQSVLTKGFQAKVKELPAQEAYAGYAFAYFTGEGYSNGEQIYFARSVGNNPLAWQELNGGNPVLTSELGELGVRDPFIIRSPEGDKFYMIATDLKIYGNGNWNRAQTEGSRSIMVWESTDLINWSKQRMVEVAPPEAGNTWAPEVMYDTTTGEYVVFWASKVYADATHSDSTYQKILYAKTRDFYTFTSPAVYMDYGYSIIDTTMIAHEGKVYRISKDERNTSESTPNGKFVFQEQGTSIFDPTFTLIKEGIGIGSIARGEGPTVFKSNTEEKWYMFIDEFGGRGYVPFETTDLASGNWTLSSNYSLPSRPRHGTVIPVTQSEYNRLLTEVPHVETPTGATKVTGIALNQENVTLEQGGTVQLTATVTPALASNPTVVWSSSDVSKVTVDGTGKATGVHAGTAYITAASVDGGFIAICEVVVQEGAEGTPGAKLTGPAAVLAGHEFVLNYGLKNVEQGVWAQDFTVNYDPQKVEFLSANTLDENKFILVDYKSDPAAGKIRYLAVHLGEAQTDPNGTWMRLAFKAKEELDREVAQMSISGLVTADAEGTETTLNGTVLAVTVNRPGVPGDRNNDSKVTVGDLAMVAKSYGAGPSDPNWDTLKQGDLNNDGTIDIADLVMLARLIITAE